MGRMEINRLEFLRLSLVGTLGRWLPAGEAGPEPWVRGPEWLEKWKAVARRPVREHGEGKIARLIAAQEIGRAVSFRYLGGADPGETRRVSPGLVFQCEEFPGTYLSGFCHTRQAERVFRVELIRLNH